MWKIISVGTTLGFGVIAGLNFGLLAFLVPIILTAAAAGAIAYARAARFTLGELESALVVNRGTGNFVRFLTPGNHWIDPLTETIKTKIQLASQTVKYTSEGVQTCGGIPVKISFRVGYSIEPGKIAGKNLAKMARALPTKMDGMVQKQATTSLQHVVGELTPQELTAHGSIKKIERQIKQMCRAKLEDKGVVINDVMVENIQLPKHVRESLEAAHERELFAEQEARILERLHQVIGSFSDHEMDRLIELERIQTLGRNGVTMMYPADSMSRPMASNLFSRQ
ncbi:MAG: regulator of protease activity HflC (stomatin/prohibitin superfamily) [Cellvibrionaceae bacterium]|jgi:regulator of protease activity HflC (stomatin/prohibitin superfamily)